MTTFVRYFLEQCQTLTGGKLVTHTYVGYMGWCSKWWSVVCSAPSHCLNKWRLRLRFLWTILNDKNNWTQSVRCMPLPVGFPILVRKHNLDFRLDKSSYHDRGYSFQPISFSQIFVQIRMGKSSNRYQNLSSSVGCQDKSTRPISGHSLYLFSR